MTKARKPKQTHHHDHALAALVFGWIAIVLTSFWFCAFFFGITVLLAHAPAVLILSTAFVCSIGFVFGSVAVYFGTTSLKSRAKDKATAGIVTGSLAFATSILIAMLLSSVRV